MGLLHWIQVQKKNKEREKKSCLLCSDPFCVYITQCSPRNTAPVWENLDSLHARGDEQLSLGSTSRQEKVETSWVVQANALLYPKVAFWCLKQVLQPKPKQCLSCVSKALAACWCLVWGRWVWELLTRHQLPQREPEVCENSPPFFCENSPPFCENSPPFCEAFPGSKAEPKGCRAEIISFSLVSPKKRQRAQ